MPKDTNYEFVYYYKIACKDENIKDIYVGHTTNFTNRRSVHKSDCKNKPNSKLQKTINENGGWDNWNMIVIERYEFGENGNMTSAKQRELYWIEQLNATLNSKKPIFNNFEGETERFEDIEDKNTRNVMMSKYRRNVERKELEYLRKRVLELEEEIEIYKSKIVI